ncbi:MAG: hypothetical protein ACRDHN_19265, partial [Thermomicrobiales bacterium]
MSEQGLIRIAPDAPARLVLAARDLQRYLRQATGAVFSLDDGIGDLAEIALGYVGDGGIGDELVASGEVGAIPGSEGYAIRRTGNRVAIAGADLAGAVFGVYGLLEAGYGCGFFLGSEIVPDGGWPLLPDAIDLQRAPAFATRGFLPWYDFLSGPSAWNLKDYQLYIDRMVRMGLNFLGLHVYSHAAVNHSSGAEPFLSFEYRGVGHDAYLDTTQTERWGYQPMRTSEFAFGTDHYFAGEVFGADAAIEARGSLDAIRRGKELLQQAVAYAKSRGMKICIGFEPAAIPDEILKALPKSALNPRRARNGGTDRALNLGSEAAKEILELRLRDLLDTYPDVDAIWLWQNEDAAWVSHEDDQLPFDASYIQVGYEYLKANAPQVQLVVSGWGAVHVLLDQMHAKLPGDIAFSALNHNLGTSPTDEVYGRLGERNRWPIPWLEDDATLWQPQYHIYRFQNDIAKAKAFGADGMIGIHWRTRVIDHVAGYFARALWQPGLDGLEFYRWYAQLLVSMESGEALAQSLAKIDRTHAWPGYLDEEAVGGSAWNGGHSNEAGTAFSPLPTSADVVASFSELKSLLAGIAESATTVSIAEQARYHAVQASFSLDYVISQQAAMEIDRLVDLAGSEQRKLTSDELAETLSQLGVVIEAVQRAITDFAAVQTTTGDLGVLASLNQKYVQRAIWQRFDAIREVAAEPAKLALPDLSRFETAANLFVPVPPEV